LRRILSILICLIILFWPKVFSQKIVRLPRPSYKSNISVEEAIFRRKSIRRYRKNSLTLGDLSQLIWSCAGKNIDGLTGPTRVYPSAGGIYPIELYLVVGDVEGLDEGIYKYDWSGHSLESIKKVDVRVPLAGACLGQSMVSNAPVNFVFAANVSKVLSRYGERGKRLYLPMDIGAACENLHLQAESLGLGTVMIGAFRDEQAKAVLGLDKEDVYCIMPVGRR